MEQHYDEYPLTIRYCIAFRAPLLTLALILANGWVNKFPPPGRRRCCRLWRCSSRPRCTFSHGLGASRGVPQPQGAASAGDSALFPGGWSGPSRDRSNAAGGQWRSPFCLLWRERAQGDE